MLQPGVKKIRCSLVFRRHHPHVAPDGERASFVAEQFVPHKAPGIAAQLKATKRWLRSALASSVMDGSRNQFVSGACFALDQHSGAHWCNSLHFREQCPKVRTGPDQS